MAHQTSSWRPLAAELARAALKIATARPRRVAPRALIDHSPAAPALEMALCPSGPCAMLRFPNSAIKSSLPWVGMEAKDRTRQGPVGVALFSFLTGTVG
jgi:hypothetical protein